MDIRAILTRGLLQTIDSRVKLLTVLAMVIGVAITPQYAWSAYPLMWTIFGILAVLSHLSIWRLVRQAGIALPFTLAALPLLFTTDGAPIAQIFNFTVSDVGFARFLAIVLKSWLSAHALLLLGLTSTFLEILAGLEGLRVPRLLISIIRVMYRYLYTLKDEAERLLKARAARSGALNPSRAGGNLLWRAKVTGGMVGNLFLRSYERSERVYAAMVARGYDGSLKGNHLPPITWASILLGMLPALSVFAVQLLVR